MVLLRRSLEMRWRARKGNMRYIQEAVLRFEARMKKEWIFVIRRRTYLAMQSDPGSYFHVLKAMGAQTIIEQGNIGAFAEKARWAVMELLLQLSDEEAIVSRGHADCSDQE